MNKQPETKEEIAPVKNDERKETLTPVMQEDALQEFREVQIILREYRLLKQNKTPFPPLDFIEGFEKLYPGFAKDLNQIFKQQAESEIKNDEVKRKGFLRGQAGAIAIIMCGMIAGTVCVIVRPETAKDLAWPFVAIISGLGWLMWGVGKKDNETKNNP